MNNGPPYWRTNLVLASVVLMVLTGAYLAYARVVSNSMVPRREVEMMRADITRLERENIKLLKQLAIVNERLGLQAGGVQNVADTFAPAGAHAELPTRLTERVSMLREFLSAHPELADSEMRLLKDEDWVFPVQDMRLDTEASKRKALAQLRMRAQSRLGEMVAAAARGYADANNGQLPSTAAQLAPYLADPANADLLQGFVKPDSTAPPRCLFQKVSAEDEWYGSTCYVSDNAFSARGTGPGLAVEQAIAAFQRATGNLPADPSQVVPYLQDAVSPAVLTAIFNALRPGPGSAPVITLGGAMVSLSGSGSPP
jgi:hypothetical protein